MGKTAFVFAGQGAQKIGMGKELVENFKVAADTYDEATESLGLDIREMIFEGDESTLMLTENTQPAVVTMSIAAYRILEEKGIKPDVVAGLSLGEYSAHVASGTISFKDAVKLVKKRGRFMQEEVPEGVGAMAAILALDADVVLECCKEASEFGICEAANFNCPGQIVVSGEIKAVEKCVEIAKEKGAKRAMLLPVSAPFHCSMLIGAGDKLDKILGGELHLFSYSSRAESDLFKLETAFVDNRGEGLFHSYRRATAVDISRQRQKLLLFYHRN